MYLRTAYYESVTEYDLYVNKYASFIKLYIISLKLITVLLKLKRLSTTIVYVHVCEQSAT